MPGLNQLVDSIRGKYPGAYDDMDDATLTKQVLAKYPQYSDLAAPPLSTAAKPNVNMQPMAGTQSLAQSLAIPAHGAGSLGPGQPEATPGMGTAGAAGLALAGGSQVPILPFLGKAGNWVGANPIKSMLAIEALKQTPAGEYINKVPGISLLPFLASEGASGAQSAARRKLGLPAEASEATATSPKATPPPPTPTGNVEQPPASKPVSMGKLPWMPELEKSLGNEPTQIKPGVPIKNQVTPRESSAVEAYHYDPTQREFHVQPKGGATGYIYGDVSPEDAQAFEAAESKGKAWQQMRNNTLVGKVVNGKRVNVKPVAREGNDLTDILTRSLQQVTPRGQQ